MRRIRTLGAVLVVALVAGACTTQANVTAPRTTSTTTSSTTTTTTSSTTTSTTAATTTTMSTTTTSVKPVPLSTTPSLPTPTEIFYNGPEACTSGGVQVGHEVMNVYVFPSPNRPANPPITGTVTFSGPLSGTAPVGLIGRVSLVSECPNDVGTVTEIFSYSGDANWAPSTSSGSYEILAPLS